MKPVIRAIAALALFLWAIHGLYHVFQTYPWLTNPFENPLDSLFGFNPIGEPFHVVVELIIGIALFLAIIDKNHNKGII